MNATAIRASSRLRTIRTQIPARLDRLPWSRFHWHIVLGLGTVWVLDGLEVTIVGSIGARLTQAGSGIGLNASDIGTAAAVYVAGACLGALFFGQLTDRFGRKKLMIITLGVYIVATVATGFAFAPWYFFLCRFLTGAGIGGEYAAINSAIDELIPARNRGQVDITINGSYWVGSAIGGLAALVFLNTALFATDVGWRLAFGVGAILGLTIMLVRRSIPESPRWLFIHGREQEAERIVDRIEASVRAETQQTLREPADSIVVRQRSHIPFRELARVTMKLYPKRTILGLSLFVGQAFLYNAVTFNLGTLLNTFYGVASGTVPIFIVIFAAGNFLGPLLLGRLFDVVGRKPMISGTYLVSAALTLALALLLVAGPLNQWSFIAVVTLTFFFASAGASSAYLTVSEIFPMETRALAIALFYAIGTGLGGIIGPLLFGHLISSGSASTVAIGFFIGATVMALGGVAALVFGVRAERVSLENIAKPLTVVDAEQAASEPDGAEDSEVSPRRRTALTYRERAEEERARASEHRASSHDLRAAANGGAHRSNREPYRIEEVLAQVAQLHAQELDERASAYDELATAEETANTNEKRAAIERALAARERSRASHEHAEALSAEYRGERRTHEALAEAASERARARDERALAEQARAEIEQADEAAAAVARAEVTTHEQWAQMHLDRAGAFAGRANGDRGISEHERASESDREHALAAADRLDALRHRASATGLETEEDAIEQAAERERRAQDRDERIRERLDRQRRREWTGLRRFLPGPGSTFFSPGMIGTASRWAPTAEQDLDREIDVIARALDEGGAQDRDDLAERVGARFWGPGRFRIALREAVSEGRAQRLSRTTFGPARTTGDPS